MRRFLVLLIVVLALARVPKEARACTVMGSDGPARPEVAQRMCDEFGARLEHKTVEEFVAEREHTHQLAAARDEAAALLEWLERANQVGYFYGAALVALAIATFAIHRRRRQRRA